MQHPTRIMVLTLLFVSALTISHSRYSMSSLLRASPQLKSTVTGYPPQPNKSNFGSKRPVAILHFGPRKTATTTIQYVLSNKKTETTLANDSFVYLGKGAFTGYKEDAEFFLQACSLNRQDCPNGQEESIHFVERVQQARMDGNNVILSDEKLFRVLATLEARQRFRDVFQGFDIRVVFVYRRTFDWIVSEWNQENKDLPAHRDIVPFVDWYRKQLWGKPHSAFYLVDSIMLQPFYNTFETIQVFNMHDKDAGRDDTMVNFLCDMIPEAYSTCQMARAGHLPTPPPANQQLSIRPVVVDAKYIAQQAAIQLGWTTATLEDYEELSNKIVRYSEEETPDSGGSTTADGGRARTIPRRCLSALELEHLFSKSLEIEKAFVPEWHSSNPEVGEATLRKEFQSAVDKGNFCSVDFVTLWTDIEYSVWKEFLEKLVHQQQQERSIASGLFST